MPEIVKIPISYFEIEMEYRTPDFKMWLDRIDVVQAVYSALQPWGVKVDDLEIVSTGLPSEQGIKFKIPQKLSTFFFGPAGCKFTRDGTNWDTAQETIQILDSSLSALLGHSQAEIIKRKTVIALHAQMINAPFIQILSPFIPHQLAALESDKPKTMATVIKWEKRKVTIDGSGQLANGIFIRFEHEFDGTASYDEIARQLWTDEKNIFDVLGIQEEA